MTGPNEDEEKELEEINAELEDIFVEQTRVTYWDNEGKKQRHCDYSWGDNGC